MPTLPAETDFIVVGGGVAGLRAAITLAEGGRVAVITKEALTESNTQYAQGGVAVALSDEDEVSLHLHDTIAAGDGLVNESAARVLVEEGPERIEELIAWGTHFDREGTRLTFTREGAHSRSRVLHAGGDSTGREMGRALAAKAATLKNIQFFPHLFTRELCLHDGQVCGVELIAADGSEHSLRGRAVLLATGGAGQVFSETTNPTVATGDGIAMAYRAGALVSDMEFVQFHPTALALSGAPRFLISEAVRGEGAYLVNENGDRFMQSADPRAELAPRDVVARAIVAEANKGTQIYLDIRHLSADLIKNRFPRIVQVCASFGLDITKERIPVLPAAHYLMGGVRTDLDGRTSLAGLYAAGETACTGVHGANRLASNSLLEGLVFGARAGHAILKTHSQAASLTRNIVRKSAAPAIPKNMSALRSLMWKDAGVVRNAESLRQVLEMIRTETTSAVRHDRTSGEAANIRQCAELIVSAALAREESRGAHFRSDFAHHDDAHFKKHSLAEPGHLSFGPMPSAE